LAALPRLDAGPDAGLMKPIAGQVPRPADYLSGCRFRDRCPYAFEPCGNKPDLFRAGEGHTVACYLHDPALKGVKAAKVGA
jgi:peptide/nickel transport system ATP-binding protein